MGKISQARVREAAEDLVQWRYGNGTFPTASDAGGDMRDWQLSGNRVTAAAENAVEKTKRQPTTRKVGNIQSQITNAMNTPKNASGSSVADKDATKKNNITNGQDIPTHREEGVFRKAGDFLMFYGDEAVEIADKMGTYLTWTGKYQTGQRVTGFPFHAKERYFQELTNAGYKISQKGDGFTIEKARK
jgi:MutS domain I